MKKEKKTTEKIKLPFRCYVFDHNNKGLLFERVGNPDKKLKLWKGNYCTRCGIITRHSTFARDKEYDYY